MPACSLIREARGEWATYIVSGRFHGASAWDLAGRLSTEKLFAAPLIAAELAREVG